MRARHPALESASASAVAHEHSTSASAGWHASSRPAAAIAAVSKLPVGRVVEALDVAGAVTLTSHFLRRPSGRASTATNALVAGAAAAPPEAGDGGTAGRAAQAGRGPRAAASARAGRPARRRRVRPHPHRRLVAALPVVASAALGGPDRAQRARRERRPRARAASRLDSKMTLLGEISSGVSITFASVVGLLRVEVVNRGNRGRLSVVDVAVDEVEDVVENGEVVVVTAAR